MATDPKVQAKADALQGRKAKLVSCAEEPVDTKAKKLPPAVLATLEEHFSTKLKNIRIHTGGNAPEIAKSLKARAFTIGADIYFAKKGFAANNELIAHEVVHVVQQAGGKAPKPKPGKVLISKK